MALSVSLELTSLPGGKLIINPEGGTRPINMPGINWMLECAAVMTDIRRGDLAGRCTLESRNMSKMNLCVYACTVRELKSIHWSEESARNLLLFNTTETA
jgi:hypothetical protein